MFGPSSSDPSKDSAIGDEGATAVAEKDEDDEDRNMRRRGCPLPREEPEACPIEPVCQGSISLLESVCAQSKTRRAKSCLHEMPVGLV